MEDGGWSSRLRKRAPVPPPAARSGSQGQPTAKRRRTSAASAERRRQQQQGRTTRQQQFPTPPPHSATIDSLPEELLLQILTQLTLPERIRVRAVCRRWQDVCHLSLRAVRQINMNRYFGSLHVQCRPLLTDQRFRHVLRLLPNLQKLELGPAGARLSRNGILSIGKLCPQLIDLDISCLRMSFRALENLCRNCPRLQRINVPQLNFKEQNLEVLLKYLTELRVLELVSTVVTGDCFSLLPPTIRKVTLKSCVRVREENFRLIGDRCPDLDELCLSKTRVTSASMKQITSSCKNLRHLDISGCSSVQPEEFLESLPDLTSLAVGACPGVTKNTFRALATYNTKLERLDLRGESYKQVPSGSLEGLELLCRLPRLTWLDLSYQTEVTDAALSSLARCARLNTLLIRENYSARPPFTEKGILELAVNCRTLQTLDVSCVQAVSRHLYQDLVTSISTDRRLSLVVGGTELEQLGGASGAAEHVTLNTGNTVPDYLAVMRDDPWSDDSDSDAAEEERFADVFIDWLWLHNALWVD